MNIVFDKEQAALQDFRPIISPASHVMRSADIMHLLAIYQGVINIRPLEMGNLDFLACLIDASKRLGQALLTSPVSFYFPRSDFEMLVSLLDVQTITNAKDNSSVVLQTIAQLQGNRVKDNRLPNLYLRGPLPELPQNYQRVTILFGPALGMGDQITFFPFLRELASHCHEAKLEIFTLYPGLWRILFPIAREYHYRRRPLLPFYHLEARKKKNERELVAIIDFDCYSFHDRIIPHLPERDILEISLGRRTAWLSRGTSPWMNVEDFLSTPVFNNYCILAAMSERLFHNFTTSGNGEMPHEMVRHEAGYWKAIQPFRQIRLHSQELVVLLNTFTSKRYPFQAKDWHRILRHLRTVLKHQSGLRIIVYPGLSKESRAFAEDICKLCSRDPIPINAQLLQDKDGKPLQSYNALHYLAQILDQVDLCLTVDTFTAHLIPLFSVPTIVITDRENREFWVPSPWSFYCLHDRVRQGLSALLSSIVADQASKSGLTYEIEGARELIEATTLATYQGLNSDIALTILTSLSACVQNSSHDFPFRFQAHQWLLLWSNLLTAMHHEPVESRFLSPFLFRWQDSEFYKVLYIQTDRVANS